MQTVIYADILIFINVIITFILLLTTADIVHIHSGKIRFISGSFIGGLFSLIILAPSINFFLMLFIRFIMCLIIVLISFRTSTVKNMLRCLCGFSVISFLYAGIISFVSQIIFPSHIFYNNGYAYYEFNSLSLILITVITFLIIRTINLKVFVKNRKDLIFDIEIFMNESSVFVKALYDSGNSIKDYYTGRPVIIVNFSSVSCILTDEHKEKIKTLIGDCSEISISNGIRLLPVNTLGTRKILPVITADKAVVRNCDIYNICYKPGVAFTDDTFNGKQYEALINDAVTGKVI
ncbi:MAG: sigma-E processing peptidase SpoIIGA [Clostridia bacterium]|nr:sigma-E processing peptidase SpoIIGA [Clostridia bacterium]